jgi:hypothetical protein
LFFPRSSYFFFILILFAFSFFFFVLPCRAGRLFYFVFNFYFLSSSSARTDKSLLATAGDISGRV